MKLELDLDIDGQYDDLTQFGPTSLTMSLNTSQLQSFGLDLPGQHPIGLKVGGGAATDLAILHVVPEPIGILLALQAAAAVLLVRRLR